MEKIAQASRDRSTPARFPSKRHTRLDSQMIQASFNLARGAWFYWKGVMQYTAGFMTPYQAAVKYFAEVERRRSDASSPWRDAAEFMELLLFNMNMATRGAMGGLTAMNRFHSRQFEDALTAFGGSLAPNGGSEDVLGYSQRQLDILDTVVNAYPQAIRDIKSEYGFHFDNGGYSKVAETDRFVLYQVLPSNGGEVRENGKPIIILPPYVLGANVLALLPGERRSYVHAFADQGIPTYIRIVKDIETTPAVQVMTGEDDARDTQRFAQILFKRHQKPLTLNGFCQGGFMGVLDFLSGELDGLIDAIITCVAPMDGSRSKSLVEYINHLPPRYREIGYALKTLPSGHQVVDGKVMSWVFKLKSMDSENPLSSFYRDLMLFDRGAGRPPKISKIAAAVNHWLTYDRTDLPLEITRLSLESYMKPVAEDGTLPVKLFGRPLNFKRVKEKGIKWLICIAENDELTEAGSTLSPLDFVDAEVAVFPKGHASIATSWSVPTSECALHTYFDVKSGVHSGRARGPVRFQLDLDGIGATEYETEMLVDEPPMENLLMNLVEEVTPSTESEVLDSA